MRLPILDTTSETSAGCCGGGDDASTDTCGCGRPTPGPAAPRRGVARRSFLRTATAVTGGLAAFGAALSPLREIDRETDDTFAGFFQKHYKEMTPEDKEAVFARIRERVRTQHGVDATIADPPPLDGVEFVYALNLSRCNGNRRCVHACVAENNQGRSPEMQYIRVIEMPGGTLNLESGDHRYDDATVPREGRW
ncbi:MAG: hypothetical protein KJO43_00165, partial [Phycisphaerae bacterium]|nr:hypothetical protein [Phycisphaerae bacterium]